MHLLIFLSIFFIGEQFNLISHENTSQVLIVKAVEKNRTLKNKLGTYQYGSAEVDGIRYKPYSGWRLKIEYDFVLEDQKIYSLRLGHLFEEIGDDIGFDKETVKYLTFLFENFVLLPGGIINFKTETFSANTYGMSDFTVSFLLDGVEFGDFRVSGPSRKLKPPYRTEKNFYTITKYVEKKPWYYLDEYSFSLNNQNGKEKNYYLLDLYNEHLGPNEFFLGEQLELLYTENEAFFYPEYFDPNNFLRTIHAYNVMHFKTSSGKEIILCERYTDKVEIKYYDTQKWHVKYIHDFV